jgi:cyclopropane fatty-acyl-phospholipid synthase-like methyltransferase
MSENNPFANLDFEAFRKLAMDPSLSIYEKIGFPNAYREGYEKAIFVDILTKLPQLNEQNKVILDIGPGCSELPEMLIQHCRQQTHQLVLIDSKEMLDKLSDDTFITKLEGYYPDETAAFIEQYKGKIDAIIVYSVIQYVFAEGNIYDFLDKSLALLKDGGRLLIGDIPNVSKRKRFFSSETGIAYHKKFMKTDAAPEVKHQGIEFKTIDDSVLFGLMQRARQAGFDSYLLPQADNLPMANRREDLLILRP